MNGESNVILKGQRDICADILRGFCILLMVAGHIDMFGTSFDVFIHIFHMQIFFFISGYFFQPEKINAMNTYTLRKFKSLIVPFLVFAFIDLMVGYVLDITRDPVLMIKMFVAPNHRGLNIAGAVWFLPCLFLINIYFASIVKLCPRIGPYAVLTVAIAESCLKISMPFTMDTALIGGGIFQLDICSRIPFFNGVSRKQKYLPGSEFLCLH